MEGISGYQARQAFRSVPRGTNDVIAASQKSFLRKALFSLLY